MNKYFLSIITVLLIIQSLFLIDDIFFPKKKIKNVYSVSSLVEEIDKENEEKLSDENLKIDVDFDKLFINANFEKGKKIVKQCAGCHDLEKSKKIKVGPPLWSIVGKQSASSENFDYSESLKNFKKEWSVENLYYFLEDPKNYISGTKMIYKGLKKSEDRVNLIQYLKSLK